MKLVNLVRRLPRKSSLLVILYLIVSWLIIRKGQEVCFERLNLCNATLSIIPISGEYQLIFFVNTLFFVLLIIFFEKIF